MRVKCLSLKDLAIWISDYLSKHRIDTILSGGACVSIYSDNKYLSYDLDFVLLSYISRKRIVAVLEHVGFHEDGRHFRHAETPFILEFLAPPPSVGEEPVREINEIRKGRMVLKLLSPTDCVKDRLAAFYHWDDRRALDQAVLVCTENDVDMRDIERWSLREGMREKFGAFCKALQKGHEDESP